MKYRAAYAANDIGHLEVDNENDDLGDGSLQTEEVSVLVFQGLIHQKIISMWTNLRLIHSSMLTAHLTQPIYLNTNLVLQHPML